MNVPLLHVASGLILLNAHRGRGHNFECGLKKNSEDRIFDSIHQGIVNLSGGEHTFSFRLNLLLET
jgi:hypothetical protein